MKIAILLAFCLLLTGCGGGTPSLSRDLACHIGAYRLANGEVVDLAQGAGGLRWRMLDGRTGALHATTGGAFSSTQGQTDRPDGATATLGACGGPAINFRPPGGTAQRGERIIFSETETHFRSGAAELFGRLVLPAGNARVPIMVLVHGSERYSAAQIYAAQRLYPVQGIGIFVYDKRGTGSSTGAYTQSFNVLAQDAVAALAEARRLAGNRVARIGFEGESQGGWVAPLAASRSNADFVIVGYGMANSPFMENRLEVRQQLTAAGYGADVLAKADEVTDAVEHLLSSHMRQGYDELARVVAKYSRQPWYSHLGGEFTGPATKYPVWLLRIIGPSIWGFFDVGLDFQYDPMPTLNALHVPLLWVLAANDTEAPPELTHARLLALQAQGRPIDIVTFPNAEHGMIAIEHDAAGSALKVGYVRGYWTLIADWARTGQIGTAYGNAIIEPRHAPAGLPQPSPN